MNPDLRDKMLRLMGGCEHDWEYHTNNLVSWHICKRCGANFPFQPVFLPAVGDGHEPTMEELAEVWPNLHPDEFTEIQLWRDPHDGEWTCNVLIGMTTKGMGYDNSPTIALASALDAATRDVGK